MDVATINSHESEYLCIAYSMRGCCRVSSMRAWLTNHLIRKAMWNKRMWDKQVFVNLIGIDCREQGKRGVD